MINSISLTQVDHFYSATLDLFYNALDRPKGKTLSF